MKDIDALFELLKVQKDFAIHHENQRSTISNLLLTVAIILIGFITYDHDIARSDLPASFFLVIIGIFSCFFTLKNYERFRFHYSLFTNYLLAIDAALQCNDLNNDEDRKIRDEIRKSLKLDSDKSVYLMQSISNMAKNDYIKEGGLMAKIAKFRVHQFWIGLHLFISVIGLYIIYQII